LPEPPAPEMADTPSSVTPVPAVKPLPEVKSDSPELARRPAAVAPVQPAPEPGSPPARPVTPTPTAVAAADPAPAEDTSRFGLKEEPLEPEAIKVVVVDVSQDLLGKHIFKTEDGQIWMQTENRKARFRSVPFEARIRGGSLGSYFLQPVTGGPSVRVKRAR